MIDHASRVPPPPCGERHSQHWGSQGACLLVFNPPYPLVAGLLPGRGVCQPSAPVRPPEVRVRFAFGLVSCALRAGLPARGGGAGWGGVVQGARVACGAADHWSDLGMRRHLAEVVLLVTTEYIRRRGRTRLAGPGLLGSTSRRAPGPTGGCVLLAVQAVRVRPANGAGDGWCVS